MGACVSAQQDGQDAGTCPRSNTNDGDSKAFVEQHTRGTPSSAVAVDTRNTPGNSPCGDAQLQHTDSTCSSPALETRDTSRQLHESSHTATPCTSAQVSGVAAGCSLAHTELRCPEIQNVLDAICQVWDVPVAALLLENQDCGSWVCYSRGGNQQDAHLCAMGLSNLDRSQVTSIGDAQRAPHALAGAAAGTRSCLAAPLKLWEGRATGIVGFASAQRLSLSEAHSQLIMNFASIAAHEIETDQRLASQLKPHSAENGDKPQAAGNSFTLCMGVGPLTSYNMHAQLLAGSCVLLVDTRDAEWPVLYATSGWRALTGMAVSEAVSSGIDALFETASDAPIANEGTRNDAKQGNSFVTQKVRLRTNPDSQGFLLVFDPATARLATAQQTTPGRTHNQRPVARSQADGLLQGLYLACLYRYPADAQQGEGLKRLPPPLQANPLLGLCSVFDGLRPGRMVGEGRFGIVYQCTWHNAKVAVKVQDYVVRSDADHRAAESEVRLGQQLSHLYLTRFVAFSAHLLEQDDAEIMSSAMSWAMEIPPDTMPSAACAQSGRMMPMMPMFQPVPENSTMTSETLPNFMDTAGVLQRSKSKTQILIDARVSTALADLVVEQSMAAVAADGTLSSRMAAAEIGLTGDHAAVGNLDGSAGVSAVALATSGVATGAIAWGLPRGASNNTLHTLAQGQLTQKAQPGQYPRPGAVGGARAADPPPLQENGSWGFAPQGTKNMERGTTDSLNASSSHWTHLVAGLDAAAASVQAPAARAPSKRRGSLPARLEDSSEMDGTLHSPDGSNRSVVDGHKVTAARQLERRGQSSVLPSGQRRASGGHAIGLQGTASIVTTDSGSCSSAGPVVSLALPRTGSQVDPMMDDSAGWQQLLSASHCSDTPLLKLEAHQQAAAARATPRVTMQHVAAAGSQQVQPAEAGTSTFGLQTPQSADADVDCTALAQGSASVLAPDGDASTSFMRVTTASTAELLCMARTLSSPTSSKGPSSSKLPSVPAAALPRSGAADGSSTIPTQSQSGANSSSSSKLVTLSRIGSSSSCLQLTQLALQAPPVQPLWLDLVRPGGAESAGGSESPFAFAAKVPAEPEAGNKPRSTPVSRSASRASMIQPSVLLPPKRKLPPRQASLQTIGSEAPVFRRGAARRSSLQFMLPAAAVAAAAAQTMRQQGQASTHAEQIRVFQQHLQQELQKIVQQQRQDPNRTVSSSLGNSTAAGSLVLSSSQHSAQLQSAKTAAGSVAGAASLASVGSNAHSNVPSNADLASRNGLSAASSLVPSFGLPSSSSFGRATGSSHLSAASSSQMARRDTMSQQLGSSHGSVAQRVLATANSSCVSQRRRSQLLHQLLNMSLMPSLSTQSSLSAHDSDIVAHMPMWHLLGSVEQGWMPRPTEEEHPTNPANATNRCAAAAATDAPAPAAPAPPAVDPVDAKRAGHMGGVLTAAGNVVQYPVKLRVFMVMEYMDAGSLQDAIDQHWLRHGLSADHPVNLRAVLATAVEVSAALLHLHQHNVCHCDLSANNILLKYTASAFSGSVTGRQWCAKVCDLGMAVQLAEGQSSKVVQEHGAITHCAPETLEKHVVSKAADVYSLGVILWQMLTSRRPWHGLNHHQILVKVGSEKAQLVFPDNCHAGTRALAEACLSVDPSQRPSSADVLSRLRGLLADLTAATAAMVS